LPETYGLKPHELAELMNLWRAGRECPPAPGN